MAERGRNKMRKILLVTGVILVLACIFAGCSSENSQEESKNTDMKYYRIDAEEAYEMMEDEEVTIVDVRRKSEYKSGHIPEAILIPLETIKDTEPEELPDKEAIIMIYCRSGNRSKDAAEKLAAMGYENIYEFGGINAWPYEITMD